MAELTPDGLAVKTPPRKVLDPWPMPTSTRMECTCLEGPKLLERNGWFYLNVAEGGTAGPAPATRWSPRAAATPTGPGSSRPTIPSSTRPRATTAGSRWATAASSIPRTASGT